MLPPYSSETVDVSGGLVFVGYGVVSTDLSVMTWRVST